MMGDTAIGWKSSTQILCVMTAASEAEYVALCVASKEGLFMKAVLLFLQPDNHDAKAISDNPSNVSKT